MCTPAHDLELLGVSFSAGTTCPTSAQEILKCAPCRETLRWVTEKACNRKTNRELLQGAYWRYTPLRLV